jgi:hypothetical protein
MGRRPLNLEVFSDVGQLGIDTAPLIYLVERHATFGPSSEPWLSGQRAAA